MVRFESYSYDADSKSISRESSVTVPFSLINPLQKIAEKLLAWDAKCQKENPASFDRPMECAPGFSAQFHWNNTSYGHRWSYLVTDSESTGDRFGWDKAEAEAFLRLSANDVLTEMANEFDAKAEGALKFSRTLE